MQYPIWLRVVSASEHRAKDETHWCVVYRRIPFLLTRDDDGNGEEDSGQSPYKRRRGEKVRARELDVLRLLLIPVTVTGVLSPEFGGLYGYHKHWLEVGDG